jgi:hypothetical protein
MKRIIGIWVLAAAMLAGGLGVADAPAGQCVFQATERVYLEIFPIDQSGMAQTDEPLWAGWLDEGMQTSFDSNNANVAYRVKSEGDDTGTDYTSDNCVDGEVFLIP